MFRSILLFSLILLVSGGATAGIIKVPEQYSTIQAGINAAFPGDTMLVAAGTYYENIDFKGKAITVASHFLIDGDTTHVNSTIIDGSKPSDPNKGSVVSFVSGEDTTSVICGFTITGGSGTYYAPYTAKAGGGIYCYNSGCKIIANKIINNSVTGPGVYGGGLAALPPGSNAWVVLKDNQIAHNTATANSIHACGGGVWIHCHAKITTNLISYNTCIANAGTNSITWTGGIGCHSQDPLRQIEIIMEDNTITHNSIINYSNTPSYLDAIGCGVAIQKSSGRMTRNEISYNEIWDHSNSRVDAVGAAVGASPDSFLIESNIIRKNTYYGSGNCYGGGLRVYRSGVISVINNLIEGNLATHGGGVVVTDNITYPGKAILVNNTIVNNTATYGGGIYVNESAAWVMNTIIWGNQAPTGPAIHNYNSTIYIAHSDVQGGWTGTGNIKSDPLFVSGSALLSDASPCIGAGIASFNFGNVTLHAPDTDILGNIRPSPSNSRPDMGAFEHERAFPKRPNFIEIPNDYPTIQTGIDAATKGDTVLVAAGTYYENINFKGKAITVASHFIIDEDTAHVNSTIIDGSQPTHPDSGSVVYFVSGEDTTSVLCGLTITKGTGTNFPYTGKIGGGILCYKSGARILNNTIINNSVNSPDVDVFGGGLAAIPEGENAAYVILKDNHIKHNTITANKGDAFGGGAALYCSGMLENNQISFNSVVQNATDKQAASGGIDIICLNLIMEHNKLAHNSVVSYSDLEYATAFAGGCWIQGCQGRFSRNEVSHNEIWIKTGKNAVGAGMEIFQVANSFIIEGNIIKGNAITHGTGWGGAAGFGSSSPHIINNIIAGNSATRGGALFFVGSDVRLINNTIINNQASYGGAIYAKDKNPVLMNSIIWNNQASTDAAIHIESGTVQAAHCDIQGGWAGTGNINADPLFADTLFHLSDGSPCIGAGIAKFDFGGGMICHRPATDIAGNSRPDPAGSNPDMGAYESPLATEVINFGEIEIPKSYFLAQNYPNPFNPATTIEFALPKSAFVTLKVYNLLGEEVASLVTEKREAGIHQLNWDARGLASGVYLYRMEAGEFVQSKKLILMR